MRDALHGVALAFAIALGSLIVSIVVCGAWGWSLAAWVAAGSILLVRALSPRVAAGAAMGLMLSLAPMLARSSDWTLADSPTSVLVMFMGVTLAFPLTLAWGALHQRYRGAIEADHDGDGWVRVDGVPRFVAELATRPRGPVFLERAGGTRTASYRDDGVAKIFTVAKRTHVAPWTYVAGASVVLASAPLWIARVYGLL